jgi:hypothetical protein
MVILARMESLEISKDAVLKGYFNILFSAGVALTKKANN